MSENKKIEKPSLEVKDEELDQVSGGRDPGTEAIKKTPDIGGRPGKH